MLFVSQLVQHMGALSFKIGNCESRITHLYCPDSCVVTNVIFVSVMFSVFTVILHLCRLKVAAERGNCTCLL